jgi:hypothetical protein
MGQEPTRIQAGGACPTHFGRGPAGRFPADSHQPRRVIVERLPKMRSAARRAEAEVAKALELPLAEARVLLATVPVVLPMHFDEARAEELVHALERAQAHARHETGAISFVRRCSAHPAFIADGDCRRCSTGMCTLCAAKAAGRSWCASCLLKESRRKRWFRIRLGVLAALLSVVLLWAWSDTRERSTRNEWSRGLRVALVVVQQGDVKQAALQALCKRVDTLEAFLENEFVRYGGRVKPFHFAVYGPVESVRQPPRSPDDKLSALAQYAYGFWRFRREIDALVGLVDGDFDSVIYVLVRPPEGRTMFVEGLSQLGGRTGLVEVQLDETMADPALAVVAHELFHTLGATDKYDAAGRVLLPAGLAEPERSPQLPQRFVELMARGRPVSPGVEVPPKRIDELRVGATTAREIGWTDFEE